MPQPIPEHELLRFLDAVARGEITLTPDYDPQRVYAGNVRYTASNGWRMVIFNDANEWDYIDAVETPDGRSLDYHAIDDMPTAGRYEPDNHVSWLRYGIPGYLRFRCKSCSADLTDGPPFGPPFLCRVCREECQD